MNAATTDRYLFEDKWAALHAHGVELLKEVVAWVAECRGTYDLYEPVASEVVLAGGRDDDTERWTELSARSGLEAVDGIIDCLRECVLLDPGSAGDVIDEDYLARLAERYGVVEHLGERRHLRQHATV